MDILKAAPTPGAKVSHWAINIPSGEMIWDVRQEMELDQSRGAG